MADDNVNRDDIENGILDWLQFGGTPRKVVARRKTYGRMHPTDKFALRVARELQDDAKLSILTRIRGNTVEYVAERVA